MYKSCKICIHHEDRVTDEYLLPDGNYWWEWYVVCTYGTVPAEARKIEDCSEAIECEFYSEE